MYKTTVAKSCANRAAVVAEIWTQLIAMGWTLHDNQDGSSYRVYSSSGELGDQFAGYIKIDWITANVIRFTAYTYWNAVTHAGTAGVTTTQVITTSESGTYMWIYGSKNVVMVITKVSTTYYKGGFGHLPKRFWTKETTLTSPASSGSSVTLVVASTSGFKANEYYQIVGSNSEGRDKLQVTGITDGFNLVVASLPRNYGIGAKFGQTPMRFGTFAADLAFQNTCDFGAVGTTNIASNGVAISYGFATYTNPDTRGEQQYLLQPILEAEGTGDNIVGYIDEYFFECPTTSITTEDTFDVGRQDTGTAESATVNTLTDSDKLWTGNAWANKVVIITVGTGVGQIRKISSNTATQLTVSENWTVTPSSDSQYIVADEAYRYFSSGLALREGV